jgi:hypothetical protein
VEVALAQRVGRIATSPSLRYEPSVSVRLGRDRLKIGFDLGFAHNASSTPLRYDRVAMGVGV